MDSLLRDVSDLTAGLAVLAIPSLSNLYPVNVMTLSFNPLSQDLSHPSQGDWPLAISLKQVGKNFAARNGARPFAALTDVDLQVGAGRILGVIGPSGAGKSTLIRLVNGLEKVSSGTLTLLGEDATHYSEKEWRGLRGKIGMIFQHFNLLSSRTVYDNIALPLEIQGYERKAIDARVRELLPLVGLEDKASHYPSELSGGQKQRVGIARALASKPDILLCDEATSALDPDTTKSILSLLKTINRQLGVTILVITHEIPVIKDLCDDVAVIDQGQIIECGPVFDVFTNPRHAITARFVETVTHVEIPAHLVSVLQPEASPRGAALLKITFTGQNATSPVISHLTNIIGADINIVAGRIDAISERPFGTLLVSVPAEPIVLQACQAAIRALGLTQSLLGYLAPSHADARVYELAEFLRTPKVAEA